MVEIHYCSQDNQPLCRQHTGEAWLWTVATRSVTCISCGLLLVAMRRRALQLSGANLRHQPILPCVPSFEQARGFTVAKRSSKD